MIINLTVYQFVYEQDMNPVIVYKQEYLPDARLEDNKLPDVLIEVPIKKDADMRRK